MTFSPSRFFFPLGKTHFKKLFYKRPQACRFSILVRLCLVTVSDTAKFGEKKKKKKGIFISASQFCILVDAEKLTYLFEFKIM